MSDDDVRFRFECLKRSRVAKHEVLSRVLRRKVSDGKLFESGGIARAERDAISPALMKIKALRERLDDKRIKDDEGKCDFLLHFPDVEVGYDKRKQIHYLIV
jgi:hypothetical protein